MGDDAARLRGPWLCQLSEVAARETRRAGLTEIRKKDPAVRGGARGAPAWRLGRAPIAHWHARPYGLRGRRKPSSAPLAFGASASNPPALRSSLMERDKPRAQGARRGARRALRCGPEWESRAPL
jgi:hypothetical protein